MPKNNKSLSSLIPIFFLIGILAMSSFACNAGAGSPTSAVPPTVAVAETVEPTDEPGPPAEPTQAVEEPQPTQEAPAEEENFAQSLIGFWRAKILGKEVIIFEFQDGGKTTWHYRYNNGQTREISGTYSVEGNTIKVDVGGEQVLTAEFAGDTLTLTGEDNKSLSFRKIESLNSPSPTASTNIAQDIVAKWHDEAADEWIEFRADSTLTVTAKDNNLAGTYTVDGSTLTINLENQESPSTFKVEIDGNVMTLTAADGSFIDYVK